jgi:hypothetical protein
LITTCRYLGALVVGAVDGASKQELLSDHYSPVKGHWKRNLLTGEIAAIAAGVFKKTSREFRDSYIVHSGTLLAFYRSNSFREGLLMAVNPAAPPHHGARIGGEEAIPASWRSKLVGSDLIASFVKKLFALAQK